MLRDAGVNRVRAQELCRHILPDSLVDDECGARVLLCILTDVVHKPANNGKLFSVHGHLLLELVKGHDWDACRREDTLPIGDPCWPMLCRLTVRM